MLLLLSVFHPLIPQWVVIVHLYYRFMSCKYARQRKNSWTLFSSLISPCGSQKFITHQFLHFWLPGRCSFTLLKYAQRPHLLSAFQWIRIPPYYTAKEFFYTLSEDLLRPPPPPGKCFSLSSCSPLGRVQSKLYWYFSGCYGIIPFVFYLITTSTKLLFVGLLGEEDNEDIFLLNAKVVTSYYCINCI